MPEERQTFEERRRQLLQDRVELTPAIPASDIPDISSSTYQVDTELEDILNRIDILTAYRKWCGKMNPNSNNRRTEGIKISCPKPDHRDSDPSAWVNTQKGVWFCGGCQEGGDMYDIAAYYFSYSVPGYKRTDFPKLKQQMAEAFGYTFKTVVGQSVIIPPELHSEPNVVKSDIPDTTVQNRHTPGPQLAVVHPIIQTIEEDEDESIVYPTIEWQEIIPKSTFLYEYISQCSNDDSPEEYHFWHGLLAAGHAAGRNIILDDSTPVYANLLVCLLGGTGFGKSRSRGWLNAVIKRVMPFKDNGASTSGIKIATVPASGEFLIKTFQHEIRDPGNIRNILGYSSVNGIVDFDEFAGFVGRASRAGSTLKSTVMQLADARDRVTTGSLTHGDFIALDAFCSITATTQPKSLRTLITRADAGSGFLNRWVFVGGPAKEKEVLGGSHSNRIINLDPACERLSKIYGWSGIKRQITVDPEALKVLRLFFEMEVYPAQAKDETDLLKRLDLLLKKLILLFAINEMKVVVDISIIERVKALFSYILACYEILNVEIGITISHDIANEIMRHVDRHYKNYQTGPTSRDISKYMARKNYAPDLLAKTLDTMIKLDWIDALKSQGKGRPCVRYYRVSA